MSVEITDKKWYGIEKRFRTIEEENKRLRCELNMLYGFLGDIIHKLENIDLKENQATLSNLFSQIKETQKSLEVYQK